MAGLLIHHGGFKPVGREGGMWRLRKGEVSIVVGAVEEVGGFERRTPEKPPVDRWTEAFPHLSEVLKPLYRISSGDVGVLKFLEGREEEVLNCLCERSPHDCALMLYLKYTSLRGDPGDGEDGNG